MRTLTLDGARLAVTEMGDPEAEPVVLLHGYPANHLSGATSWPGWPRGTA